MSSKILMPALSPTMTEGNLVKWFVKVGDLVKAGDVLAEIETDKATMEVEAVDEGTVTQLIVTEGTNSVQVNSIIAILDGIDEPLDKKNIALNKVTEEKSEKNINNYIPKKLIDKNKVLTENFDKKNFSERILASPFAKNLAKKHNIKLEDISGSGPNGRIIKRDFNDVVSVSLTNIDTKQEIINPSSIRKIIAERTTHTKQTVPHFYLTIESNVDKLIEMRKKINENSEIRISVNDILVKAIACAQKINPSTNVSWINGKIIKYNSVDVSVAVALKEGLVTPIIKNADIKGLKEISNEIKYLANKAKDGKLLPEEYNGGTISISNLGMFGINEFSAIINPPQSSILAVGAFKKIPSLIKGKLQEINILKSTLSADHRVLDGAVAGKLLKDFNDIIENPFNLWINSKDMEII